MSARTDAERREAAHADAIERGKTKLRRLQIVLVHFAEGLSVRKSAQLIGVHRNSVLRDRAALGLARWVRGVDTAASHEGESSHGC